MSINIGINGLGRIGRLIIRSIYENKKFRNIKIKHINSRSDIETVLNLIKYDSAHGAFKGVVNFNKSSIIINGNKITYTKASNINDIDWQKNNINVVLECTGNFNSKEKLTPHLKNGANKVLVSAPCVNADKTIVYGVNHRKIEKKDNIISAGSCTTNCLAPVVDVLNKKFGIVSGFMTTIHSYTSDQRLIDNSHKDPRRARSASQSIIPTSTGASKSIGEIIPKLNGKLSGIAMRVPTPNVSLIEFVFNSKKKISIEAINKEFIKSSKGRHKDILSLSEEKLVSIDYNHNPHSAIVDASLTSVIGNKMGKVTAWYDNEWGFSNRMCDLVRYINKNV